MIRFNQVKEKHFERLQQFVPIVDRVHGGSHPEFHDVRKLFDEISIKVQKIGAEKPELDNEFKELRKVTNNYTVPSDVCESYEAVYNMLSELDEAYYA
ncbi:iron-sulfur cluster repair di-iron protein, ric [Wansuia hejianensis]|uniref:Iron-sulfur cluster repair di-iron protein, ric n=1 Tax=Wansuia hejianensis TaxID=2763667 RepID=A0A926EU87_9FIRM|nr:iron-sulfur cluster repair di-iron protein, ric [Wansuia hejianensis]MBC8589893.1 iron-sulfur cluster repair di-iron protein, ric [Wansuia hejianensis]